MRDKRSQFKIQLMEPKPLTWWRSRRAKIDMDPPYQRRGRLWSDTDKSYLIDSILNGYDVPKLYMADFTWGDSTLNKKRLPYAIIDGKQRFEAIFDFFDGTIVLNDDFTYLPDPALNLGGLAYKDLQESHAEIAEAFETYPLTIMGVVANTEEPINELFVRLNRSKSLTGAEIRNAMVGPTPEVIRLISKHPFFRENIAFAVKRGADLNAAAKVLLFEHGGKPAETKRRNLDEFVAETGGKRRGPLELSARKVIETLDDMSRIFLPKDTLLASGGVLPVYYWLIRGLRDTDHRVIREFLVDFEHKRKQNRERAGTHPGSGKLIKELVEFDNFNRSTNDLQSHVGRYDILLRRFKQWLNSRGKRS